MATKKQPKKKPAVDEHKFKQWREQGRAFKAAERSLRNAEFSHQWKIADWMRAGEKAFGETKAGKTKTYDEAEKVTGFTRETLEQFAHTAKNVLIRVKGVSFGHHRLVARYTPEEQARHLKHAKDTGKSVESFAAYLKALRKDAAIETRSPADVAASKVIEACDHLLGTDHFDTLLAERPSPKVRTEVLDRLKEVVTELNNKVEELEAEWCVKAKGAGAAK